jgi:hypothetical protein
VGKHTDAATEEPPPSQRRRLLGLAAGVTLTVVAWGFLVYSAIDFGSQARGGDTVAWSFLAFATVGAIACLFMALILGTRLVSAVRGQSPPEPPVAPGGGKRARRD